MKVKDPIYGTVVIQDEEIHALIETKAFQRLSLIKQQGHTYFLHRNALHTRIEHSVGVYVLMEKMIAQLTATQDISFSDYERKVAIISALLHDIGHGPFSHCFQKICGQDHNDWTIRIIQEDKEIRTILNRIPHLLEDVVKVLNGEGHFPIIEEMMYASLGVDQLDYWNRDLYHSSLSLELFPIDELIAAMCYINHQLVIEKLGIPLIEQLVDIKQHLYHNGFGHPFVIGKDLLFQEIFREVRENNVPFSNPVLHNFFVKQDEEIQLEDFLPLHDEMIHNEIEYFASRESGMVGYLAKLYLDPDNSLEWKEGTQNEENMYISHIVTEQKNYSSYTGGIFVQKHSSFEDILHLSDSIRNIAAIPAKEHIYFLEDNLITNK